MTSGDAALNGTAPLNDTGLALNATAGTTPAAGAVTVDLGTLDVDAYELVVQVRNTNQVESDQIIVPFTVGEEPPGDVSAALLFNGVALAVEVAFVSDATDENPTWTDVTGYVQALNIQRGRQRELERWEPSTLTAVLDNRSRVFDQNLNGYALPMRRVRVRAAYDDITYDLFYGFADEWAQTWSDASKNNATVTLTATDAFKVLAARELKSAYYYTVVNHSPLAYYRLDETSGTVMYDASGNDHNGTYSQSDTTTRTASGLIDYDDNAAITFDGSSDYAKVATGAQPDDYPCTFECWFSTSSSNAPIWYQTTGDTRYYISVAVVSGAVVAKMSGPTSDIYTKWNSGGLISSTTTSTSWADGSPHHLLVRFTNNHTAPTIYIDGSSRSVTASVTGQVELPVGRAFIGRDKSVASVFDGTLDEIAIYGSDLGADTAADHYASAQNPWQDDLSSERVTHILDAIEWNNAARTILTGDSTVYPQDFRSQSALDALLQVATTENGSFYVAPDGSIYFRNRHALLTDVRYSTVQAVFGDNPQAGVIVDGDEFLDGEWSLDSPEVLLSGTTISAVELPYTRLNFGSTDELLRNVVTVESDAGVRAFVKDDLSKQQFLPHTYTVANTLLTTTDECAQFAQWILNRYKYPTPRINQITVSPRQQSRAATETWRAVLGLGLEQRVEVIVRPRVGAPIDQEAHIESIAHEITPETWETTYQLSPADNTNYLLLDDLTLAQLDANALAY